MATPCHPATKPLCYASRELNGRRLRSTVAAANNGHYPSKAYGDRHIVHENHVDDDHHDTDGDNDDHCHNDDHADEDDAYDEHDAYDENDEDDDDDEDHEDDDEDHAAKTSNIVDIVGRH